MVTIVIGLESTSGLVETKEITATTLDDCYILAEMEVKMLNFTTKDYWFYYELVPH